MVFISKLFKKIENKINKQNEDAVNLENAPVQNRRKRSKPSTTLTGHFTTVVNRNKKSTSKVAKKKPRIIYSTHPKYKPSKDNIDYKIPNPLICPRKPLGKAIKQRKATKQQQ
jgi:hypothetical protein